MTRKPLKLILGLISKIPCWLGGSRHKWRRLRKAEIFIDAEASKLFRICDNCGNRRILKQRKAKGVTA